MTARHVAFLLLAGGLLFAGAAGCGGKGGSESDAQASRQQPQPPPPPDQIPPPARALAPGRLDIDGDGKADFALEYQTLMTTDEPSSYQASQLVLRPLEGNRVYFDMTCGGPCPLPADTLVTTDFPWSSQSVTLATSGKAGWTGPWAGVTGGLLAVERVKAGQAYVGWIKLSCDRTNGGFEVLGSALQTRGGAPLRAGAMAE